MTTPVATLAPTDSQDDALRLMEQRNVRRIPLVEAGRLVGIVTLDDLVLDEAAPLEQVAAVVQSQIGEGGTGRLGPVAGRTAAPPAPSRPTGACSTSCARRRTWRHRRRRRWRWRSCSGRWCVGSRRTRQRTSSPSSLPCSSPRCALPPGPDKLITRQTIETELGERLDVESPRAAHLLDVVVGTIAQIVSPGQMQDVRDQLPEGLRSVLSGSSPVAR